MKDRQQKLENRVIKIKKKILKLKTALNSIQDESHIKNIIHFGFPVVTKTNGKISPQEDSRENSTIRQIKHLFMDEQMKGGVSLEYINQLIINLNDKLNAWKKSNKKYAVLLGQYTTYLSRTNIGKIIHSLLPDTASMPESIPDQISQIERCLEIIIACLIHASLKLALAIDDGSSVDSAHDSPRSFDEIATLPPFQSNQSCNGSENSATYSALDSRRRRRTSPNSVERKNKLHLLID